MALSGLTGFNCSPSMALMIGNITDTPDEENKLVMMAKINFAATQVGEHRNVLRFLGAVVNNDARECYLYA